MPKIDFGKPYPNIDPVEFRDGVAAGLRDGYRNEAGNFIKRQGHAAFTEGLAGPCEGQYETISGKVLAVAGGVVYELAASGTKTAYTGNALNTGTPCVFAEDGSNVFIAHGGKIAKLNTGAKTVALLGGNSPDGVTHIVFQKGYLLTNGTSGIAGDTFYSDDKTNGYEASNSWEVFNNEALPDGCNALVAGWEEIYALGSHSVEVSYNDGTTPWAVLSGASMQYGCLAPYSIAMADNTLFWLSNADNARRIVKLQQRTPQIISTPYDRVLQDLSAVTNARAWIITINGHSFYVITFPTADITLAYNIRADEWSQWGYWDTGQAEYQRHKINSHAYISGWNKHLIGDRSTGIIHTLGGLTDNGNAIRFELTSGHNSHGTDRKKRSKRILYKVKRGQTTGTSEPQFSVRYRDDGGAWSNEKVLSLGKKGETDFFVKTRRGGTYRQRQYQVIHADTSTDFILVSAEEEANALGR